MDSKPLGLPKTATQAYLPFRPNDELPKLLSHLKACHTRALQDVAFQFLYQDMSTAGANTALTQIAEEAIFASLKLASMSLNLRPISQQRSDKDFAILAAGRLGALQMDFYSPLDLVLISRVAQSNAATPVQGIRSVLLHDDDDKLLRRAMGYLTSPELFGYKLNIYQGNVGWTPWQENNVSPGRAGQDIFEPKQWLRDLELNLRADDRQRIVPLRWLAGDSNAAKDTLEYVSSFAYKQYLSKPELTEFGALYRSLTMASDASFEANFDPSQPSIRGLNDLRIEFEFLVRYLQLRFGWRHKQVRTPDFDTAISALLCGGFIDAAQRTQLSETLQFLNELSMRIEAENVYSGSRGERHLPPDFSKLKSEASRYRQGWRNIAQEVVGFVPAGVEDTVRTSIADAVLTPQLSVDRLVQYVGRLGYDKPVAVAGSLRELESEEVSILSDSRCRFYFSRIAAMLLERIAGTPNPTQTLEQLITTTRSLGGKGILWQLFDANEACLDLYVRLCGSSPYLTTILASNPGMLDELLDSLMLANLPSAIQMDAVWQELNRGSDAAGAHGIEPLLGTLKNAMHLNVGVREILGHGSIAETHDALTNIGDLCVQQIVDSTYEQLVSKHGIPHVTTTGMCPFTIFTFGKYGGREPNYHSDMTLLCLYQAAGKTKGASDATKVDTISNAEFYQLLCQRVGQRLNKLSRTGKLFDVKFWNLANSSHAPLAWSIDLLRDFFLKNPMTTSQKLEMSKARVVYGTPTFAAFSHSVIQALLSQFRWNAQDLQTMLETRKRLEGTASESNIKRGRGGTMDVELLAQSLTLAYSLGMNAWEPPSTFNLLSRLSQNQIIQAEHAATLRDNYDFLRSVESGLRLMNTSARHDLPTADAELDKLAYVLRIDSRGTLLERCTQAREQNRELFKRYIEKIPSNQASAGL